MATAHISGIAAGSPIPYPADSRTAHADGLNDGDSEALATRYPAFDDSPPANPAFVFPAHPESPSSAPPSFSRSTGRRPMSAIESRDGNFDLSTEALGKFQRPVALPAFSFNPGAALPSDHQSQLLLSPPITPNTPRTIPSPARPAGFGHRRGGSEFVGGRLREGNSIAVMSTSPTKSESGFASPTFQPPRRGHRRGISGTISTNDLPILTPSSMDTFASARSGSAPTSPTGMEVSELPALSTHGDTTAMSESNSFAFPLEASEATNDDLTPEPVANGQQQQRPATKARVGFSDTLEFIPRPLSLVSSDTSSTMTARPGHVISSSLSSIVPPSSPTGRQSPVSTSKSPVSVRDTSESRPSTAGAILERTRYPPAIENMDLSPRRRNSIPALLDAASDANGSPGTLGFAKSSKRWSFFGLEALAGSGSPTKRRPTSSCSSESTQKAVSPGSTSDHGSLSASEDTDDADSKRKSSDKKGKKKRKMKGWAGSILPRKAKSQNKRTKLRAKRPATPPAPSVSSDEEEALPTEAEPPESVDGLTVTIAEPTTSSQEAPKPSKEDVSYQMIDLDAALGPFNTPLPHNPEWEAAQRAAGNTGKRRLHSAQGMKGFTGPGMHYHRRAESAPDLPPFNMGRSLLHRFGSSSTMDDVFEEEEEDEDGARLKAASLPDTNAELDGDTTPPAGSTLGDAPHIWDGMPQVIRRTSSSISDRDQSGARSVRTEHSKTSLHEDVIAEEPSAIFAQHVNIVCGSQSSTASIPASPKWASSNNESFPLDARPISFTSPATTPVSASSIHNGSPFSSSQTPSVSLDTHYISSAIPYAADEHNFQSLLMGEPGPEVRMSVDYDIPSLTSSTSVTTRESFAPNPRIPTARMLENRPVSVSSAFGRRRASLVSLSRLISSSHGERSKLSMEVRLDGESESGKRKASRAKRLTRMVQFWKPHKETTAA